MSSVKSDAKTKTGILTEGSLQKNGDDEHSDKSLRQLYGILEGRTDEKNQNTIDPEAEFKLEDDSNVMFDFLGVESIEDITPLLPPRARDSIVDTATVLPNDDDFQLYPELLKAQNATDFDNIVIKYLGGTKIEDGKNIIESPPLFSNTIIRNFFNFK